jgi:hypothetical protein
MADEALLEPRAIIATLKANVGTGNYNFVTHM